MLDAWNFLCVIKPGKISLICKIHFINGYITDTPLQKGKDLYMTWSAFPHGRFLGVNHTQSREAAHWLLLHLVVWCGDPWLLLYVIALLLHSTRWVLPTTYPLHHLHPTHPFICVTQGTFNFLKKRLKTSKCTSCMLVQWKLMTVHF